MPDRVAVPRKKWILVDLDAGSSAPLSASTLIVRRAQLFGAKAINDEALPTPNTAAVLIGIGASGVSGVVANLPVYNGSLVDSLTLEGSQHEGVNLADYYAFTAETGDKVLILADL